MKVCVCECALFIARRTQAPRAGTTEARERSFACLQFSFVDKPDTTRYVGNRRGLIRIFRIVNVIFVARPGWDNRPIFE